MSAPARLRVPGRGSPASGVGTTADPDPGPLKDPTKTMIKFLPPMNAQPKGGLPLSGCPDTDADGLVDPLDHRAEEGPPPRTAAGRSRVAIGISAAGFGQVTVAGVTDPEGIDMQVAPIWPVLGARFARGRKAKLLPDAHRKSSGHGGSGANCRSVRNLVGRFVAPVPQLGGRGPDATYRSVACQVAIPQALPLWKVSSSAGVSRNPARLP
jgi:hypothetical protein